MVELITVFDELVNQKPVLRCVDIVQKNLLTNDIHVIRMVLLVTVDLQMRHSVLVNHVMMAMIVPQVMCYSGIIRHVLLNVVEMQILRRLESGICCLRSGTLSILFHFDTT